MKLPIFLVFALTNVTLSSQSKGDSGKQIPATPACKNFVKVLCDQLIPFISRVTERLMLTISEVPAGADGVFLWSPHSFGVKMQSSRQSAAWSLT